MQKINESTFPSFIAIGSKVVEFTAGWCIDCKRVAPDMPDIAKKFADQFTLAELDIEEAPDVAEQYNVKGIPTFIIFEQGQEVGRLPSRYAKTREQIEEFLTTSGTQLNR